MNSKLGGQHTKAPLAAALSPFVSLLYSPNLWCEWCEGWPQHRGLRPLIFWNSGFFFFFTKGPSLRSVFYHSFAFYGPKYQQHLCLLIQMSLEDDDTAIQPYIATCTSQSITIWQICMYGYKGKLNSARLQQESPIAYNVLYSHS